jgi:hypothetical protein
LTAGFNSSEMQVLYGPAVDNSQISMQMDSQTQYLSYVVSILPAIGCLYKDLCVRCRPQPYYFGYQSPKYPIDKQFHPGFMSYQVSRLT